MSDRAYPKHPLAGVCAAVWHRGRVAIVRRGNPPSAGSWALPGGLVDAGETLVEAVQREVLEETRLRITTPHFVRIVEVVQRDGSGLVEHHYVLAAFAAHAQDGIANAASDATDLVWVTPEVADQYVLLAGAAETIAESRAVLDAASQAGL